MSDPTSLDWYPSEDEDRRDAMRDEDASCGHLNADPEGRGWKCRDCGVHVSHDRMLTLTNRRRAFLSNATDSETP